MSPRSILPLALLPLALPCLAAASPQDPPGPRIAFGPAPFELPAGVRDSVRFGYVEVPRDHGEPDGARLRLALVVVPALREDAAPDPIVFIPGGAGQSATLMAESFARSERIGLYRARRAVLLLDPRGHGFSEPATCPELDGAEPLMAHSDRAEAIWLGKLASCRERLVAAGVRLETLSSVQAARDLEVLRRALGAPSLNLIGTSYGTRIAAEAMRQVPAAIRAVNLVGPVPPGLPRDDGAATATAALAALVRRCGEHAQCRAAYPDLAGDLEAVLDRAGASPVVVRVRRSDLAPEGRITLGDSLLREALAQLASDRELAAGAPLLIHALAADGDAILSRLAPGLMRSLGEEDLSAGTKLAFLCNDVPRSPPPPALVHRRCLGWIGEGYGDAAGEPVRGGIPTLVLAGELDPRTPPSNGRFVARELSRATVVAMPWTGHDRPPDCAIRVTAAFFDDPGRAPDAACMDAVPPIAFVTGVTPSRWIGNAVGRAAERPLPVAGAAGAALLLLLVPVVGLPARAGRARRREAGWGGDRTGVVVWLAAAAALALLVATAAAVLAGARRHFFIPALGVPASWSWVLALPWLAGGLAVAAGILAARRRRAGPAAGPGAPGWAAAAGIALALALWAFLSLP